MSETTNPATATGIATPDTSRETFIGWNLDDGRNRPTNKWNREVAGRYRQADSLYRKYERFYEHLDQVDAGLKNGPAWWNQAYFTVWTNRDLISILARNLELLPHQQNKAKRYFLQQDLRRWGIRKELVAWATCAYVVHSDEKDKRRSYPSIKQGEKAEQFWDIGHRLDLSMDERTRTYHKVKTDMETGGSSKRAPLIYLEGYIRRCILYWVKTGI